MNTRDLIFLSLTLCTAAVSSAKPDLLQKKLTEMNTRDLIFLPLTLCTASVSSAKPNLLQKKLTEMNTRDLIFGNLDLVKQQAKAMASTVSLAKPYLPQKLTEMSTGDLVAGLGHVKNQATVMISTREGAVGAAALVIGGAVGAYFLWPTAAAPAAAGAVMKAPGAAGFVISRVAYAANPQLYYQILRTAGAAAAAAAFAL